MTALVFQQDSHEARINDELRIAYQREKRGGPEADRPMELDEVFEAAPGDGEDEMRIRRETVIRMLYFIFQKGCHPGQTLRLLYILTQRLSPELILHMNGTALANIFGETRAAWSARMLLIFNGYLAANGQKAIKYAAQKSDTARAKYAAAAIGNSNRRALRKPDGPTSEQ
jgi:hypothetical protein